MHFLFWGVIRFIDIGHSKMALTIEKRLKVGEIWWLKVLSGRRLLEESSSGMTRMSWLIVFRMNYFRQVLQFLPSTHLWWHLLSISRSIGAVSVRNEHGGYMIRYENIISEQFTYLETANSDRAVCVPNVLVCGDWWSTRKDGSEMTKTVLIVFVNCDEGSTSFIKEPGSQNTRTSHEQINQVWIDQGKEKRLREQRMMESANTYLCTRQKLPIRAERCSERWVPILLYRDVDTFTGANTKEIEKQIQKLLWKDNTKTNKKARKKWRTREYLIEFITMRERNEYWMNSLTEKTVPKKRSSHWQIGFYNFRCDDRYQSEGGSESDVLHSYNIP